MFQKVFKVFQNVSKCLKNFQKLSKHFIKCQNVMFKIISKSFKNSSNLLAANLHICLSIINSRLKNSKFWKNPKSNFLNFFCKNPK